MSDEVEKLGGVSVRHCDDRVRAPQKGLKSQRKWRRPAVLGAGPPLLVQVRMEVRHPKITPLQISRGGLPQ